MNEIEIQRTLKDETGEECGNKKNNFTAKTPRTRRKTKLSCL
jgi:hypothetical protein